MNNKDLKNIAKDSYQFKEENENLLTPRSRGTSISSEMETTIRKPFVSSNSGI